MLDKEWFDLFGEDRCSGLSRVMVHTWILALISDVPKGGSIMKQQIYRLSGGKHDKWWERLTQRKVNSEMKAPSIWITKSQEMSSWRIDVMWDSGWNKDGVNTSINYDIKVNVWAALSLLNLKKWCHMSCTVSLMLSGIMCNGVLSLPELNSTAEPNLSSPVQACFLT